MVLFKTCLALMKLKEDKFIGNTMEENLLFINAWNEWAEGNHLEPCLRHGHNWLDAVRHHLGNSVAGEDVIG